MFPVYYCKKYRLDAILCPTKIEGKGASDGFCLALPRAYSDWSAPANGPIEASSVQRLRGLVDTEGKGAVAELAVSSGLGNALGRVTAPGSSTVVLNACKEAN